MAIKDWSTTSADNDDADATINWLENQAPSSVNNSARAMMAAIRTWYEDVEWRDLGHTVTRTGNTTFTIGGGVDLTTIYTANRPIRCTDSSTLYGVIASSSYLAPTNTITVTLDSGNLSASLTAVSLGLVNATKPIHVSSVRSAVSVVDNNTFTGTNTFSAKLTSSGGIDMSGKAINFAEGTDVVSAATCDIWATTGNTVHVTGSTGPITSLGTAPQAGAIRGVIFDSTPTLTNGANLILPGAADITAAAGDSMEVYADTTTQMRVVRYTRAASAVDVQTFDSSGTWTKPAGFEPNSKVEIEQWGAGGSGGKTAGGSNGGGGGGGGYYNKHECLLSQLSGTETATVGVGGASVSGVNTDGNVGGTTQLGTFEPAYGGGGGGAGSGDNGGGGGGGAYSAGSTGPVGGAGGSGGTPTDSYGGGAGGNGSGSGAAAAGNRSIFGGGGGGGGNTGGAGNTTAIKGGNSVYGGGGGGGGSAGAAAGNGGTSTYGGNGGAGAFDGNNATAGTAPGGGGGGCESGNSGAGANGRIKVTVTNRR